MRAEAQAFIDRQRTEHAAQVAELQGKLSEAQASNGGLLSKVSDLESAGVALREKVAELQGKLDAAATATSTAKKK